MNGVTLNRKNNLAANSVLKYSNNIILILSFLLLSLSLSGGDLLAQDYGWTVLTTEATYNHRSIFFIDENMGWIVGQSGLILKTTDSGENWTPQDGGTTIDFKTVFFVDESTGWIGGFLRGAFETHLFRTTDGGNNWSPSTLDITVSAFSLFFIDANIGWVVGGGGTAYKTIDGGENWISFWDSLVGGMNLTDVFFINSDIG